MSDLWAALKRAWREASKPAHIRYLEQATDHADLERRLKNVKYVV